ncbi:MAG TPA: AAA family ATPase [Candidatus Saccharimonadales bacterium]|nr:AAA family ATPase [Candidatus Saccharimonadales bacterium]
MSTVSLQLDYHHPRAVKARFGRVMDSKGLQVALWAVTAVTFIGSLAILILLHQSAGWLVAIPGFVCLVLWIWYRQELRSLPVTKGGTIADLLERNLLGKLPAQPSPRVIANALAGTSGFNFMHIRFTIDPGLITNFASEFHDDSSLIWHKALELSEADGIKELTSAAVTAAIVLSLPNVEKYLAELKVDPDDLRLGVAWYTHIKRIFEDTRNPINGGVARDWAFGFTPLLDRFGYSITMRVEHDRAISRDLANRRPLVDQIVDVLVSGRRNATLVGGVGSGRSMLVSMLAEELINPRSTTPKSLKYNRVIGLDPGVLIANAGGRGELENLVQQIFAEAFYAKNIILFLDNADLFLEEGTGSVNLSNILMQALEGGALRIILAMDDQCWLRVNQTNPSLGRLFNRISVEPLSKDATMRIMEDYLLSVEYQAKVTYLYQALEQIYSLSERYIADQVMPGRALKLLEAAAHHPENGYITAESVQQTIEANYNIKVGTAHTEDERETLLNLEDLIHRRMVNQSRAVQVVASALRRARAGVRNPNRPIGTFLFLGPTGVGKTELAKSLAAAYFGGEDRLIRIDLNEFVRSDDLIRLIADGATDPKSLAAQVSKQPFSVVLLDEIEKAHTDVMSALLQVLDEGILRDKNNREVSFRDAIIVATSNAGAAAIRAHIEKGEEIVQFESSFVDELINSNQFRPEFLNRFDEIVLFRPLTEAELVQVVDLNLAQINKTLAVQKMSVSLTPEAKQWMAKQGYDPRLGARPLRRVMQRTVEDVIAKRVLAGQIESGDKVTLDVADLQ